MCWLDPHAASQIRGVRPLWLSIKQEMQTRHSGGPRLFWGGGLDSLVSCMAAWSVSSVGGGG